MGTSAGRKGKDAWERGTMGGDGETLTPLHGGTGYVAVSEEMQGEFRALIRGPAPVVWARPRSFCVSGVSAV